MRVDGDRSIKPQALRDLEALGVKVEMPQLLLATHEDDGGIEVEQENYDAVRLFVALDTQWRVVTWQTQRGGVHMLRTGLDMAALEPTARAMAITLDPAGFAAIKTLEVESVGHFESRLQRKFSVG